jgi:drug/metabolite transporter (DMT)-like permease
MHERKSHLDRIAVFLLLSCCLFWGFQQVLVKATLPHVPALFQAALRFAGATLVLYLWCRWRKIELYTPGLAIRSALLAGVLFGIEFIALYMALAVGTAARVTLFLYAAPFWVALLLPWFVKAEGMRRVQWVGLILAFVGLCIALGENLWGASPMGATLGADVLAVLAGLFWGFTTVIIRSSGMTAWPVERVLFYQVATSAVMLPIASWAIGEPWNLSGLPAFAWWSLIIQTLVGAFLSYLTWMWLLAHYPATRLGAFTFLTPLFALVIGALWLGEAVTPALLIALATVAVGIVLVNR